MSSAAVAIRRPGVGAARTRSSPLLERCRGLFRGFDRWRTDRLKVCFYTVTEDERFVVEKLAPRAG